MGAGNRVTYVVNPLGKRWVELVSTLVPYEFVRREPMGCDSMTESMHGTDSSNPALIPAPAAGWYRRAWGFLFDAFVMALLLLVWVIPYMFIYVALDASGWLAHALMGLVVILSVVLVIAYPVYFIGKGGQTPGMKLLKIRLYRLGADGELYPPTYGVSWGRWGTVMVLNLLSGALFGIPIILDYLWAAWDTQRQCLHDKVVGTVAVDERE